MKRGYALKALGEGSWTIIILISYIIEDYPLSSEFKLTLNTGCLNTCLRTERNTRWMPVNTLEPSMSEKFPWFFYEGHGLRIKEKDQFSSMKPLLILFIPFV